MDTTAKQDLVRNMLIAIGEDPTREGLLDTPKRVVKAWNEMFAGYRMKPEDIATTFDADGYNELVLLKGIEFYSTCVAGFTMVETPKGRMPLFALRSGDWIYSFNEQLKTFEVERCLNPRVTQKDVEVLRVISEKDTLLCTPDHKFLTYDGWVEAKDLRPGTRIISVYEDPIRRAAMFKKRSESVAVSWEGRRADKNHKILGVDSFHEKIDVWCLDAPKNHNFVANGMVVHNCEHHMLSFSGKAHVGYIPNGKIIGISKLARILDIFAKRLQIQERIGQQVTRAINDLLDPVGSACIIEAQHLCMRCRGVEKQESVMITSSLTGVFLEHSDRGLAARAELMSLIRG